MPPRLPIPPLVLAAFLPAATLPLATGQDSTTGSDPAAVALYADAANFQNNDALPLAIETWDEFLDRYPDDSRASSAAHYRGVAHLTTDPPDFDAAIESFDLALAADDHPLGTDTRLNLAYALESSADGDNRTDRLTRARDVLVEHIERSPDHASIPRALTDAARLSAAVGDLDAAVTLGDRLLDRDDAPDELRCNVLYNRGTAAESAGRVDLAVDTYRRHLDDCPSSDRTIDVRVRLADLLAGRDETGSVVETLTPLTDADPADPLTAYGLIRLAAALAASGATDRSVETLDRVAASADESYASLAALTAADTLVAADRLDDAETRLRDLTTTDRFDETFRRSAESRIDDLLMRRAGKLAAADRPAEAVALAAESLDGTDATGDVLADRLVRTFDWAAADDDDATIERLIADFPDASAAALARGRYRLATLRPDDPQTADLYRAAADDGDDGVRPAALWGWATTLLGDDDRAAEADEPLTRLIDAHPDHPLVTDARLRRGLLRSRTDRDDEAAADLRGYLARTADDYAAADTRATAHYELAAIADRRGDDDAAAAEMRRVLNESPDSPLAVDAAAFIAAKADADGDLQTAAEMYDLAAGSSPDSRPLRYRQGWAQFKSGNFDAAATTFEKLAADTPPDATDTPTRLEALSMAGQSRFESGDDDAAARSFEAAREIISTRDVRYDKTVDAGRSRLQQLVLLRGGQSAARRGQHAAAVEWFEELGDRFPSGDFIPQMFFESGRSLAELGRDDEALESLRQVAEKYRDATAARARFWMGEIRFGRGEHAEALRDYQRVMFGFGADRADDSIKPWQARAGFEAARVAESMAAEADSESGKDKAVGYARKFYRYVTETHPNHDLASRATERLSELTP